MMLPLVASTTLPPAIGRLLEEKALVQIRRLLGAHHGHITSGSTCRQP